MSKETFLVAVDPATNKVIGQLVEPKIKEAGTLRLLTREGYKTVSESTVKVISLR